MHWTSFLAGIFIGFAGGIVIALLINRLRNKTARELAGELFRETEARHQAQVNAIIENVKASFGSLSLEALSKSSHELIKLAKASLDSERDMTAKDLDARKSLIDQQLKTMSGELEKVARLMQELERDRVDKFSALSSQLKSASEQTQSLIQTTTMLKEALASSRARGQWGERMAEDVLRFAGFVENINYLKQKGLEGSRSRPDFTFILPNNLTLNMDVKFPYDNYIRYLEADNETEKQKFKAGFLKDVRARFKEVTTRDYINPENNTIDAVLLFIPNEQIYAFIHEQDSTIIDEGLKNKVVLCSPITLFAVLAIVRQAVDNFALSQTSNEILSLLGLFKKQWDMFLKKLETFGKRISDANREFDELMSTRKRQLERPLEKLEDLRTQKGLDVADEDENANRLLPRSSADNTGDDA